MLYQYLPMDTMNLCNKIPYTTSILPIGSLHISSQAPGIYHTINILIYYYIKDIFRQLLLLQPCFLPKIAIKINNDITPANSMIPQIFFHLSEIILHRFLLSFYLRTELIFLFQFLWHIVLIHRRNSCNCCNLAL